VEQLIWLNECSRKMPHFHELNVYVQCKETHHYYKLSSDEKDTIAIRAGKAKVVEKLNSFLSIWVIRIRVTHLLVQFKLYKRSQFTVHSLQKYF